MSEKNSTPVGGFLAAFAIGALAGAAIALLYAPHSGEETRELLAAKGRELKEKATDAIGDARDFIDDKKEKIVAAIEAGKDAMHDGPSKQHKRA